jgi:hypothetical protein
LTGCFAPRDQSYISLGQDDEDLSFGRFEDDKDPAEKRAPQSALKTDSTLEKTMDKALGTLNVNLGEHRLVTKQVDKNGWSRMVVMSQPVCKLSPSTECIKTPVAQTLSHAHSLAEPTFPSLCKVQSCQTLSKSVKSNRQRPRLSPQQPMLWLVRVGYMDVDAVTWTLLQLSDLSFNSLRAAIASQRDLPFSSLSACTISWHKPRNENGETLQTRQVCAINDVARIDKVLNDYRADFSLPGFGMTQVEALTVVLNV